MELFRAALSCALALLILASTRADEKSHPKAAEDLFTLCQYEKTFSASLNAHVDVVAKQYPEYAQHRAALKRAYEKVYDFKEVKEEVVKLTMKEFTEKELGELTAFYRTPVGQKMITRMPEITKRMYESSARMMTAKQDDFMKVLQEEMEKDK